MSAWGPQPVGYATAPAPRRRPVTPAFWVATLVGAFIGGPVLLVVSYLLAVATWGDLQGAKTSSEVTTYTLTWQMFLGAVWLVFPLVVGFVSGRRRRRRPDGRRTVGVIGFIVWPVGGLAYLAGYGLSGAQLPRWLSPRRRKTLTLTPTVVDLGKAEDGAGSHGAGTYDPLRQVQALAADNPWGKIGGHVGWHQGRYISANPRGGVLVIGPPGSGKSSALLIPSVIVAPGACVSSSIKGDVMEATSQVRARSGTVWHFDPGGDEATTPGVRIARWSPLVSIHNWEDARRMANRMAEPMRKASDGNGAHFIDRARDWLEVLLFAAFLGKHPIATAADWANTPTDLKPGGTVEQVLSLLEAAEKAGDRGARIAHVQMRGLLSLDDRERSGISSSLVRMMRLYGSVVARDLGESPNFDPVTFVRSNDTLYVTAGPDKQAEYAPLIASLLEEIRFATYARHAAEEARREPTRPHVTFVLDEANNTAPIPLPAIISEAGGQSLHIIVGIQDLSRARGRWGKEADGFLTLFPTKVVLPGLVEPYTLDALSNAAGEYDRQMVGYSESTAYVGQHGMPLRQTNPTYSVQRQKVLHQGDIANLPAGTALLWEGAVWHHVDMGLHWRHPTWREVIAHATLPAALT